MSRQTIARDISCAIHILVIMEPSGQTCGPARVPVFASGYDTVIRRRCACDIAPQHIDPLRIHGQAQQGMESGLTEPDVAHVDGENARLAIPEIELEGLPDYGKSHLVPGDFRFGK